MQKTNSLLYALILLLTLSCQEATDIYIGIPLQPNIEENNYTPGLNIFGVIRPDYTDTVSNSFVHVQKVAPAINNYPEFTPDSLIVKQAEVSIKNSNNTEYTFEYTNFNNQFTEKQYRPMGNFNAVAGDEFYITCSYEDLPILSSTTIVPNKPILVENSLQLNNKSLSFEIAADTSAYIYYVYVFSENSQIGSAQFVSQLTSNTLVNLKLDEQAYSKIEIYAYDYNLANYYLNSNTSLNFNKYRVSFGNVENGYGVFGSLNFSFFY